MTAAQGNRDEHGGERAAEEAQIRSLAHPLATADDLEPLVRLAAPARFVCLGEASHGTQEYYHWRALLSRRLIEEYGFTWIGVEGDWPDCWRINRWVRGESGQEMDARRLLAGFERWPTWMWANHEVAEFLTWLREWNLRLPEHQRTGFYGLDVYSLWDSLREIFAWLEANAADALPSALQAWHCFIPFREDPQRYAMSNRLVPQSCEADVVALLAEVRRRTLGRMQDDPAAFDAIQNAIVATNAERYYRTMVRGDQQSWNIRDHHMSDTIERIAAHHGPASKGLVWRTTRTSATRGPRTWRLTAWSTSASWSASATRDRWCWPGSRPTPGPLRPPNPGVRRSGPWMFRPQCTGATRTSSTRRWANRRCWCSGRNGPGGG
ncbi:erythromycin esterase [Arthrobacter sp. AG367]|nr:erythromycin esterase [Arthrobacter sp. AG367]